MDKFFIHNKPSRKLQGLLGIYQVPHFTTIMLYMYMNINKNIYDINCYIYLNIFTIKDMQVIV